MTDPSTLDIGLLREQARTLRQAAQAGDATATARVLASHPKYAGRAPERLQPQAIGLRDAQVTIAREHGFDSWSELLDAVSVSRAGSAPLRWTDRWFTAITKRAFEEAQGLDHSWCGPEHALLAILRRGRETPASLLLADAGLSYEEVRTRLQYTDDGTERTRLRTNPAWHQCMGIANGIALSAGSERLHDEHVLIALLYVDVIDDVVEAFDVTRTELYELAAAADISTPSVAPAPPRRRPGPMGPRVYYPAAEHQHVLRGLNERIPRGVHWGWNTNGVDVCWVDAEDDVDLPAIMSDLVLDPGALEIVPWREAIHRNDFNKT